MQRSLQEDIRENHLEALERLPVAKLDGNQDELHKAAGRANDVTHLDSQVNDLYIQEAILKRFAEPLYPSRWLLDDRHD